MYQLIVFDMDGTLLTSKKNNFPIVKSSATKLFL